MDAISISFVDFSGEVLALYRASRAPRTAQKMAQVLAIAASMPAIATPADLTPSVVAGFSTLVSTGRHPNTAATLMSYLRRVCSYAEARGLLAQNPFKAWPDLVRMVPSRGPNVHSIAAIGRVLGDLEARASTGFEAGRLHALACVLAHTGLRRDEALFLRDEDLDLPGRTLEVRRRLKRPTARRRVPLTPDLLAALDSWLPRRASSGWLFPNRRGNPWSGGQCGSRPIDKLREAAERVKVEGFTPASLRHSYATACATIWDVPPAILQKLMGHTDIRTTMKFYVHLETALLISATQKIHFRAS